MAKYVILLLMFLLGAVEIAGFLHRNFIICRMFVFHRMRVPVDIKDIDRRLHERGVFAAYYLILQLFV